jgi:nitroimidazol reductase NimA-like FMN-containing flavoprotein (pyridoxamine 5'-phosphate oxidase superfamily)
MTIHDQNPTTAFEQLTVDECWRLVIGHGIGRIGFVGDPHVQIVPTRFDAERGTVYFRAGTFGEMARRVHNSATTLQVDDIDPTTFCGWSVLITGTAHRVGDAATMASRWSLGRPRPWFPAGPQSQWIALSVEEIKGHRVLPVRPTGRSARAEPSSEVVFLDRSGQ